MERSRQRRRRNRRQQKKNPYRGLLLFGVPALLLVVLAAAFLVVSARQPEDRDVGALIRVNTTPVDGARVTVGGVDYGETPTSVTGLPAGDVYLIVQREGYKQAYESVTVPPAGTVDVEIEIEPIVGYVTFESEPIGAQIFLDGIEPIGYTPLKGYPVPIGDHRYELRLEDYQTYKGEIEVEENRRYTKSHVLDPLPATLLIQSRPSGARIWIDGIAQTETTPARKQLPPDTYTITVYSKGFVQGEETIQLEPNDDQSLDFVLKPGDVPPGMVLVPAGNFIFGDDEAPEEKPKREMFVDAFYIDKYEVSNADYKAVFPTHTFDPGTENWPVRGVSWKQASEYAKRVGKRLPTEVEWEKAARGTDGRQWPWGNAFDPARVNYKGSDVKSLPVPVGENPLGASPYKCLNMAGNVYEWVQDWYNAYEGNQEIVADYGQVYRVLRGGSFMTDQFETRCAARHFDIADAKEPDYGFRCALDVTESTDAVRPNNAGGR